MLENSDTPRPCVSLKAMLLVSANDLRPQRYELCLLIQRDCGDSFLPYGWDDIMGWLDGLQTCNRIFKHSFEWQHEYDR